MSRLQVVVSPLGFVMWIGGVDVGKSGDDKALDRSSFNKDFGAFYGYQETRSDKVLHRNKALGERDNLGTGAPVVMLADQGYPLAAVPPQTDWLLTRSVEEREDEEWKKASGRQCIIVSKFVSRIRGVIERVFGYAKKRSAFLSGTNLASQRELVSRMFLIHCALLNRRIKNGESPLVDIEE